MTYLDLEELPELFDGSRVWSARRPALAWFRRSDYLGDPRTPLGEAVRDLVGQRTGVRPHGPIRLLTHVRCMGHCFNPVSFYYCFAADGERVEAVVAEVTNTPWGERHAYVMPVTNTLNHGSSTVVRVQLDKQLHVSPFMGMKLAYDWRLTLPAKQLLVHIQANRPDGGSTFDATLSLQRKEIDARSLWRVLLRYPFMSLRVQVSIYAHALGLKLRGARYFPHPSGRASAT
jgi:DUF1365 family protein